jgi:hypothetical protein
MTDWFNGPFSIAEDRLVDALVNGSLSKNGTTMTTNQARKLAQAMIECAQGVWQGQEWDGSKLIDACESDW